jgi:CHAD domain-containing protein
VALPPDLVDRSASEGVRLVALAYLGQATDALARLDRPDDGEALHDFRVAVRRLRSTLRASGRWSPRTSPTTTSRLRDIGDRPTPPTPSAAGVAAGLEAGLEPRERHGLRWLVERLEARRGAAFEATLGEVRVAFPRIARRLQRRLEEYRARVLVTNEPAEQRFGPAAGDALAVAAAEFGDRLAAVGDAGDAASAHAARIAAKRVRYVLEPVADRAPDGPSLVRRLKSLQDLLGALNDCHVLEAEVGAGVAEFGAARARRLEVALTNGSAAARRPGGSGRDPCPGLVAVARLVRARRQELFDRLEEEWLADGGRGFGAELALAAADLRDGRSRRARIPRRPTTRRSRQRSRTKR